MVKLSPQNRKARAQMLKFRLGKELNEIARDNNLKDMIFELLRAAEAEGWLGELEKVASEQNSHFIELLDFPNTNSTSHRNPLPKNKVILFLAANPPDTSRIRYDIGYRESKRIIERSIFRDQFHLQLELATKATEIREHIVRYQPTIVHFSGHGVLNGIVLEGDEGKSTTLREIVPTSAKRSATSSFSDNDLARMFALSENLACVVLNSCYSDSLAKAITQKIYSVVGMTSSIGDLAAIAFAKGFYDAVTNGLDLIKAFESGRLQMKAERRGEDDKPKLKAKTGVDLATFFFTFTEQFEDISIKQRQEKVKWTEAEREYVKKVEENYGKLFVLGQANLKPIDEIYIALNLLERITAFRRSPPQRILISYCPEGQLLVR